MATTIFKTDDGKTIKCVTNKTRNGFCHRATLYNNSNNKVCSSVVSYLNRTWESYEYKTVLSNLLQKAKYPKDRSTTMLEAWGNDPELNGMGALNTLAMVMKMGEVLATDKKEANDFKVRMLKAGLPEGALNMPENWNELPEDEKERRLNGVAEIFQQ